MPHAAVGVHGDDGAQRSVRRLPTAGRLVLQDRRPDQWMAEGDPRLVEAQQAQGLRILQDGQGDVLSAQPRGGREDLRQARVRSDRGHQHHIAGRLRQAGQTTGEGPLERRRERPHRVQRIHPPHVDGCGGRGEFQQRQRIAGRLARRPSSPDPVEVPGVPGQQAVGTRVVQATQVHLVQPVPEFRQARRRRRGDHDDGQVVEPARHEGEDVPGLLVEPVDVVRCDQQGVLAGRLSQKFERGDRDEETVARFAVGHAQRAEQRAALDVRQGVRASDAGDAAGAATRRTGVWYSAWLPAVSRTTRPAVRATASATRRQAVLPIPASPTSRKAAGRSAGPATALDRTASTSSRPTRSCVPTGPPVTSSTAPPGPSRPGGRPRASVGRPPRPIRLRRAGPAAPRSRDCILPGIRLNGTCATVTIRPSARRVALVR